MSIEEEITEIVNSIDRISDNLNPNNDFGMTVGDELHSIDYNLSRIADALEQILTKIK